jgi:hypothetical protein
MYQWNRENGFYTGGGGGGSGGGSRSTTGAHPLMRAGSAHAPAKFNHHGPTKKTKKTTHKRGPSHR